jgi:hypothetical protein
MQREDAFLARSVDSFSSLGSADHPYRIPSGGDAPDVGGRSSSFLALPDCGKRLSRFGGNAIGTSSKLVSNVW